jgi:hypothetical protein
MTTYIETLRNEILFEGKIIQEAGLKKGMFNGETAHLCHPEKFMDILIQDFPQVFLTVEPNEKLEWKVTGGVIGVAEDSLNPFDSEAVAAFVLALLGHDIAVTSTYVKEQHDREPGDSADGSYFIPSMDKSQGVVVLLGTHRDAIIRHFNATADSQSVLGSNDFPDTEEMLNSYLGEQGIELEFIVEEGPIGITDSGTPVRIDKVKFLSIDVTVVFELLYCMNWEMRTSNVTELEVTDAPLKLSEYLKANDIVTLFGELGTASVRYRQAGEYFSLSRERIECSPDGTYVTINLD